MACNKLCPFEQIAVFLGPVLACLFSIFGFCIRYYDTPNMFKWMFHFSYFRAGFQSLTYTIYGLPRPKLLCPADNIYCHYTEPTKFLNEMDIVDVNLWSNISYIVIISFLMHAATYAAVWYKLNKRWTVFRCSEQAAVLNWVFYIKLYICACVHVCEVFIRMKTTFVAVMTLMYVEVITINFYVWGTLILN